MGRYDISFKSLAETSPLTLLRLFGSTPIEPGTRVSPVDRELVMSIKTVDHAFLLEGPRGRWLEHFEAESALSADDLVRICRRATLLSMKNDAPVWTTIVLLSRRHAPTGLGGDITEERGCVTLQARPRFVKLWEQSPKAVLAASPVEALPLVGGMKATREELLEAIRKLSEVPDRELRTRLFAELATWSSLQYNEIEIEEIRARMSMTLKELMLISPAGEELAKEKLVEGEERGMAAGRAKGREEGQLVAARRDLCDVVDNCFPGIVPPERIDQLDDYGQVRALFIALLRAKDRASAEAAVRDILGS
ncbi:MAG: hypothetical protein R2762_20360 [Bryobacteraceae bacterium]